MRARIDTRRVALGRRSSVVARAIDRSAVANVRGADDEITRARRDRRPIDRVRADRRRTTDDRRETIDRERASIRDDDGDDDDDGDETDGDETDGAMRAKTRGTIGDDAGTARRGDGRARGGERARWDEREGGRGRGVGDLSLIHI